MQLEYQFPAAHEPTPSMKDAEYEQQSARPDTRPPHVRIRITPSVPTAEGPSVDIVEWVASHVWDFFGSRPSRVYHFDGPVDLCFVGKPMPTSDALQNFIRRLDRASAHHGIKITCAAVNVPQHSPALRT